MEEKVVVAIYSLTYTGTLLPPEDTNSGIDYLLLNWAGGWDRDKCVSQSRIQKGDVHATAEVTGPTATMTTTAAGSERDRL